MHSNSDYPKSSLTLISEYPKLRERNVELSGNRECNPTGRRNTPGAARISGKGPVLCGDRERDQRAVRYRLFPQRHDRPRQAPGAFRSRAARPACAAETPAATEPGAAEARCARGCPRTPAEADGLERAAALQLRCVGITPRHLSLVDLEPGDCRYPYGGDAEGEAITFCGHPAPRGFELLPLAFSPDQRPRNLVGTRRRPGSAAARGGGMNAELCSSRSPNETASAAASPRASARADPAEPAGSRRSHALVALLRRSVGGDARQTKIAQ